MPNLTQLRLAAREIFDETLSTVDAGTALHRNVSLNGSQLRVCDTQWNFGNRKIHSVAIGKAAFTMAYALDQILGDSFTTGLLSGPSIQASRQIPECKLNSRWRQFEGSHPLPNETSLLAAIDAFHLLQQANEERALVIFLISGGGSAMIEWPVNDEITLADLRVANKTLVNCGASVSEINAVRRAFSAVKGGRLAMHAPNCDQITMIVSDVPLGEERNVASVPTLRPPDDALTALEVIDQYDLRVQLPQTVLRAVASDSEPPQIDSTSVHQHFVLLANQNALEAAADVARRRGFTTELAADITDQPIEEGSRQLCRRLNTLLDRAKATHSSESNVVCLISGGEFACPVRGEGLGGRNMETALRLATDQSLP